MPFFTRSAPGATSTDSGPHLPPRSANDGGGQLPHLPSRGDSAIVERSPVRPWHRFILQSLLSFAGKPPLCGALWDGQKVFAPPETPLGTIVVHNAATLWRLAVNPFYQFCEAYAGGKLDITGDLVEALAAMDRSLRNSKSANLLYSLITRWLRLPRRHTLAASCDNVYHHYDIGNDFYQLWLDEQLAYTCAYFPTSHESLEEAQVAKFDHVCRKLRLQPGERVVEAGCGWGGLALHMARHYGVSVQAYNVSREQIAYARQRAHREGLERQVTFIEDDWRKISGQYDAFVSVGMLEHVGKWNYRRLGEVINRVLTNNGRGLIHSIGRNKPAPVDPWIERRIFPGSYPPSLIEMLGVLEPRDFSVLDVENLRLHYAQTLRHWLARFERAIDRIAEMFDERFVRTWRLYLASSVAAFETGHLQLFQVVFARGETNQIPWTRRHVYVDDTGAESLGPGLARA